MNRKIIFRAKGHTDNQWLYGNLATDRTGLYVILPTEDWSKGDTVFEETIGQFTGLYDQNKTEIYEGDILRSVKFEEIVMFVVYDEEQASFMAVLINKNIGTELETRCHIVQEWLDKYPKVVIGNIHDNKDLLNKE